MHRCTDGSVDRWIAKFGESVVIGWETRSEEAVMICNYFVPTFPSQYRHHSCRLFKATVAIPFSLPLKAKMDYLSGNSAATALIKLYSPSIGNQPLEEKKKVGEKERNGEREGKKLFHLQCIISD